LDFSQLQTPRRHGETLVQPAPVELAALLANNTTQLQRSDVMLGRTPLTEARRSLRREMGITGPCVVVGHQPEFIHPGVWAKHVVAMRLAEAVGGQAVNLVVDHDAPRQLAFSVPMIRNHDVRTMSLRYGQWPRGAAVEGMPPAGAAFCAELAEHAADAMGSLYGESLLPKFFATLTAGAQARDWVAQLVAARKAVEDELDVRVRDVRVSAAWFGPLLAGLLGDAFRFAAAYNAALAEYRRAQRIRSRQRPIPDLEVGADGCETPLWAYLPGRPRQRLFVRTRGSALALVAGGATLTTLAADRAGDWEYLKEALAVLSPWRVRPRALTLTLWARLCLADLFIHGIGGAKYDRITDRLIRGFFGIAPPAMACVSATLRLPIELPPIAPDAWARAKARRRDLTFNPQRHGELKVAPKLAERRAHWVAESRRLRRESPRDRRARARAFRAIREVNAEILQQNGNALAALDAEIATLGTALQHREAAEHREYFFAMHPPAQLTRLLDNLPSVAELGGRAIV
jgi:hypothetical protein